MKFFTNPYMLSDKVVRKLVDNLEAADEAIIDNPDGVHVYRFGRKVVVMTCYGLETECSGMQYQSEAFAKKAMESHYLFAKGEAAPWEEKPRLSVVK